MQIQKFMTPGIKDRVDLRIQIYLWQILEEYQYLKSRGDEELDYFQSFHLSLNEDGILEILHKEEVPNDYQEKYLILDPNLSKKQAEEYLGFIFVIENELENGYTMLLGSEY